MIPFVRRGVYGMTERGAIIHKSSRTNKWGRVSAAKKDRILQNTLDTLEVMFDKKKERLHSSKQRQRRRKVEVSPNSLPWDEYLQWEKDYANGIERKIYKWI